MRKDQNWNALCNSPDRPRGGGCHDVVESAIADSHRRALLAAQARNETWTAIFEDDAVPVDAENWNENFQEVWAKVPQETLYVRLGWCNFGRIGKRSGFTYKKWHLVQQ